MKAISTKYDSTTENELEILLEINHENIVKYYEHFDLYIRGEDHTIIIMEYCEVNFNLNILVPYSLISNYNKQHRTVH